MNPSKLLSSIFIIVTFCHCSLTDHNTFVHTKNWPTSGIKIPRRQLAVFMDGTGNDESSRTNVRRLYEMTSARHRPDVLTYYDPGVGTGKDLLNGVVGKTFGFGFQRNLTEAMTFLATHYREGDEISIYGFSRGAYSAAILASIVTRAGLPVVADDTHESISAREKRAAKLVKAEYALVHKAETDSEKEANRVADHRTDLKPEARAKEWREAYWKALNQSPGWTEKAGRVRPPVAVLGIWDPVDSLVAGLLPVGKVLVSVSDVSEYRRHCGHHFHPFALGPQIKECLIAFSLDEERQPFLAELPDINRGKPGKYEFVWFPGDHSDLGGGWDGDKDLAGLSMNWMLSHVGERLLGKGGNSVRVYEDFRSPRHDLAVSNLYHITAYRVRGEILGDKAAHIQPSSDKMFGVIDNAPYIVPARYQGWTMKIHHSVVDRMHQKSDLFYTPDQDGKRQLVNLRDGPYDAPKAAPGRNPGGPYCPRPFRTIPASPSSPKSWSDHQWTEAEIRRHYQIVP